jgi:hypothetical protein
MFYEPITILGAELSTLDIHANYDRTNELRLALLEKGLNIVGITKIEGEKKSQQFIVVTPKYRDILTLAEQFGQKTILVSDTSRDTVEISIGGGESSVLGKLYLASKDDALKRKSYLTFSEDGKDYYFLTGEEK